MKSRRAETPSERAQHHGTYFYDEYIANEKTGAIGPANWPRRCLQRSRRLQHFATRQSHGCCTPCKSRPAESKTKHKLTAAVCMPQR